MNVPADRMVRATPAPPPTVRSLTPDRDPSAEMEALRLRRVRQAFAGPGVDDGGPSPLTRGLLVGAALGVLAVMGMAVAGVIGATWAVRERDERERSQPSTSVAPAPPTTAAPVVVPGPPPASPTTTRRIVTTTINA